MYFIFNSKTALILWYTFLMPVSFIMLSNRDIHVYFSFYNRFCVSDGSEGSLSSETGSVRSRSDSLVANAQKACKAPSAAALSTQCTVAQNVPCTGVGQQWCGATGVRDQAADAPSSSPVASEHSTQDWYYSEKF